MCVLSLSVSVYLFIKFDNNYIVAVPDAEVVAVHRLVPVLHLDVPFLGTLVLTVEVEVLLLEVEELLLLEVEELLLLEVEVVLSLEAEEVLVMQHSLLIVLTLEVE